MSRRHTRNFTPVPVTCQEDTQETLYTETCQEDTQETLHHRNMSRRHTRNGGTPLRNMSRRHTRNLYTSLTCFGEETFHVSSLDMKFHVCLLDTHKKLYTTEVSCVSCQEDTQETLHLDRNMCLHSFGGVSTHKKLYTTETCQEDTQETLHHRNRSRRHTRNSTPSKHVKKTHKKPYTSLSCQEDTVTCQKTHKKLYTTEPCPEDTQ